LRFDQIFLDPYTSEKLGSRRWGEVSLAKENLLPFLYVLHYKLALPGEIGGWLMGIVALLWTLDCFVGFYLTLPARRRSLHNPISPADATIPYMECTERQRRRSDRDVAGKSMDGRSTSSPREGTHAPGSRPFPGRDDDPNPGNVRAQRSWWQRWKPAWQIKTSRLNYDLHRAVGLWVWVMLFVLAWSGVALNLGDQVYTPVMKFFFGMKDEDLPALQAPLDAPQLSWREAHAVGQRLMEEQSARHGFTVERETWLWYDREQGVYYYSVKSSRDIGRDGRTRIAFDANTGVLKGLNLPTGQYAGDTVTNWLTSLHMARVFGRPMQVFVCLMGLVVAMLSVTGVVIWLRRRRVRRGRRANAIPGVAQAQNQLPPA
jgi:uncharacterized iron-regulated membrane protein